MIQVKTTSKNQPWSLNLRNRVGDSVTHAGKTWINKTGANSEPGIGADWEQVVGEDNGLAPVRVTRAEILVLVSSAALSVGTQYTITDADINLYGGTEITLTAITENQLSLQGSGLFYCPKYDLSAESTGYGIWTKYMEGVFTEIDGSFLPNETITANNGATAIYLSEGFLEYLGGDWNTATSVEGGGATANVDGFVSPSYAVNEIVHWGGKSWNNVNGNIGERIDKYTLDAEWQEIPFDSKDYNVYVDEIHYDFGNDMIIYRKDRYNNVVSGSNQVFVEFEHPDGYGYGNPIKDFQWGCMQDNFNTDDYLYVGIQGNKIINSYFETLNTKAKYIWNNELFGQSYIVDNIFARNVFFQSNSLNNSLIENNTLVGGGSMSSNTLSNGSNISSNTLVGGGISFNTLNSSNISINTLSNGSGFSSNTLSNGSGFQSNTLSGSSSFQSNTLSGSNFASNTLNNSNFASNTLSNGSVFQSNTLSGSSSFQSNTLSGSSSFQSNTLNNSNFASNILETESQCTFNGVINSKNLLRVSFSCFNVSLINSTATIIFLPNFKKTVFQREDGNSRLQYVNNSDVIVIADVNA